MPTCFSTCGEDGEADEVGDVDFVLGGRRQGVARDAEFKRRASASAAVRSVISAKRAITPLGVGLALLSVSVRPAASKLL